MGNMSFIYTRGGSRTLGWTSERDIVKTSVQMLKVGMKTHKMAPCSK